MSVTHREPFGRDFVSDSIWSVLFDQKVQFQAQVSDGEDDAQVLDIVWRSDIDIAVPATPPEGRSMMYLSEGSTIFSQVTDSTGKI